MREKETRENKKKGGNIKTIKNQNKTNNTCAPILSPPPIVFTTIIIHHRHQRAHCRFARREAATVTHKKCFPPFTKILSPFHQKPFLLAAAFSSGFFTSLFFLFAFARTDDDDRTTD